MGKICAFYSPLHGQCGTTATMVASAFSLAKEGYSVILVHSQSFYADLENMFFTRENKKNTFYDGIGLDGLCYAIKAGEVSREELKRAVLQLDDNIYILPSAAKRTDPEREDILLYIITEKLPLYYDYVFVDTGSGGSDITTAIRDAADVKIAVVSQNRTTLREFPEASIVICGNYDNDRKLNSQSIRKKYNKPVFTVPHCSSFADAIEASSVKQFFLIHEKKLSSTNKKSFFNMRKLPEDTEYFFQELNKFKTHVAKERDKNKTANANATDETENIKEDNHG